MRMLAGLLALLVATPAVAQVSYPPPPAVDTSTFATKSEIQAIQATAATAASTASTAQSTAQSAVTAVSSAVKSVNGAAPNASGAVTVPIPDTSALATKTEVQAAQAAAASAATAATGVVKTINGTTPNASGAVTIAIPTASTAMPPCISDVGTAGTAGTMQFAPFNHTHCSKARKCIFTSAADGTFNWTFTTGSGATCAASTVFTNPPICVAVAEVTAGITDVINVQIVGTPTISGASFLVNRTQRSVVSLIGLTVLSVPAQPGATKVHAICLEP